jgi:hypothetical protein
MRHQPPPHSLRRNAIPPYASPSTTTAPLAHAHGYAPKRVHPRPPFTFYLPTFYRPPGAPSPPLIFPLRGFIGNHRVLRPFYPSHDHVQRPHHHLHQDRRSPAPRHLFAAAHRPGLHQARGHRGRDARHLPRRPHPRRSSPSSCRTQRSPSYLAELGALTSSPRRTSSSSPTSPRPCRS